MSETVWLLKKTPQKRHEPTAVHAYYDEDLARMAAKSWSRRTWNTAVEPIEVHTEIPASTRAGLSPDELQELEDDDGDE